MYSIVIQYFYRLYSIQSYYKIMAIIPCAVFFVAYLFYTQQFVSLNPITVICPSPSPFPLVTDLKKSINFNFQSSFRITAKSSGMYREFPYTRCPYTPTTSPTVYIPHHSETFVIVNEPTLAHHYHPKSIAYIWVHSW